MKSHQTTVLRPLVDSPPARPTDDWKRLTYQHAWQQYAHEDNLAQSRTNAFLTVQGGLLLILASLTNPMLNFHRVMIGTHSVRLGPILLGSSATILALFAIVLARLWRRTAAAGDKYMHLRLDTALALEDDACLGTLGVAGRELAWKNGTLEIEVPMQHRNSMGGWAYLQVMSWVVTTLWSVILVAGIAVSILATCLN